MKNLLTVIIISLVTLSFTSCSDTGTESNGGTITIDTKDVKGTIEAGNYSKSNKLNYNNYEGWVIGYGNSEISIAPSKKTAAEMIENAEKIANRINSFGSEEIISKDDHSVLIKKVKLDFQTKEVKEEGYVFNVVIDGIMLVGSGENPLKPISDKSEAERLIKIAKSFKATK